MKKRDPVFHSLLVALFALGACAQVPGLPTQAPVREKGSVIMAAELPICAPCTREEAQAWALAAAEETPSALRAANCYGYLVSQGEDKATRLSDAQKGRKLAETAVARLPKSGLAHYLYAYLTGLEAENNPLRGLALVPVIEREALQAAQLNPALDRGGPHRMLGELYLRAPAFPVSVGDPAKAVEQYRLAVKQAPGFVENRLGLAEALLADEAFGGACFEIKNILSEMPQDSKMRPAWGKTLELLKRLCELQEEE